MAVCQVSPSRVAGMVKSSGSHQALTRTRKSSSISGVPSAARHDPLPLHKPGIHLGCPGAVGSASPGEEDLAADQPLYRPLATAVAARAWPVS